MAKKSYIGNVVKEVKQTAKRVSNAVDKADRSAYEKKYGRKMDVKIGSSKIKEQVGQLAGAVLQGRRYDDKTGKQIVTPKKSARSTTPSISQRATKPKGTAAPKRTGGPVGSRTEVPKKVRILKGTATTQKRLPRSSSQVSGFSKRGM